jgi:O-antigen/teichoic acid export membrane protein
LLGFGGFAFTLIILSSGIWGAILTVIVVTILTSAYYVSIVNNFAPFKRRFNPLLARNSMIYGFKSYLQNLVGFLQYRLDLFLIAFFLGKDDVAHYAVAAAVAGVIWHIPDSIGAVLFPKLSSTKKTEEIHHLTSIVCRHTIFITGMAALILFAASEFLIKRIYGIEYTHAIRPLLILLPGVVMMSIYKVLTRNFSSRNRQQISVVAAASALVLNVGLNILLIPQLGITGAALSSTVSYSVTSGMLLVFFLKESGSGLKETVLMDQGDFGVYTGLLSKFRPK